MYLGRGRPISQLGFDDTRSVRSAFGPASIATSVSPMASVFGEGERDEEKREVGVEGLGVHF